MSILRSEPAYQKRLSRKPCACVKQGGPCKTLIKRGEPIYLVQQFYRGRGEKGKNLIFLKSDRWRRECLETIIHALVDKELWDARRKFESMPQPGPVRKKDPEAPVRKEHEPARSRTIQRIRRFTVRIAKLERMGILSVAEYGKLTDLISQRVTLQRKLEDLGGPVRPYGSRNGANTKSRHETGHASEARHRM